MFFSFLFDLYAFPHTQWCKIKLNEKLLKKNIFFFSSQIWYLHCRCVLNSWIFQCCVGRQIVGIKIDKITNDFYFFRLSLSISLSMHTKLPESVQRYNVRVRKNYYGILISNRLWSSIVKIRLDKFKIHWTRQLDVFIISSVSVPFTLKLIYISHCIQYIGRFSISWIISFLTLKCIS